MHFVAGKRNPMKYIGTYLLHGGHNKRKIEWKWRKIVGATSIGKKEWKQLLFIYVLDWVKICFRRNFSPFLHIVKGSHKVNLCISALLGNVLAWGGPCSPAQPHLPPDFYSLVILSCLSGSPHCTINTPICAHICTNVMFALRSFSPLCHSLSPEHSSYFSPPD